MKNTITICLVLISLLAVSCVSEDTLTPSLKDEDRVGSQIDLSNPVISRLYEDFDMGLLYEYQDTLDFAYIASSDAAAEVWASVEIPMIKTLFVGDGEVLGSDTEYKAYVEEVVTMLDTTVLTYFDPAKKIGSLMPKKVLLSSSIYSVGTISGDPALILVESDSRFSSSPRNNLRTIFNRHAIVFNVNKEDAQKDLEEYSLDNFYILLSRIMGMHNLYDEIPEAFYNGKSSYYNQEMEAIYREENGIADEKTVYVVDKDWFYSKGFVDANYFFSRTGLRTYYQYYDEDGNRLPSYIKHERAILPSYSFVADRAVDVRSYINEMIHRDESELLAFPENIQENMRLLLETFDEWGVNLVGINPDLAVFQ